MTHPMLTAARETIVTEKGAHAWRSLLETELEFAKTEANIEDHVRAFKARTNPNSQLEDLR